MSDERIKKLEAAPPAMPNQPSIMSAPREPKKVQYTLILIVAIAISVALNIILAVVLFSKNQRIHQLESDNIDNEELIVDLKNRLKETTETP